MSKMKTGDYPAFPAGVTGGISKRLYVVLKLLATCSSPLGVIESSGQLDKIFNSADKLLKREQQEMQKEST
jgi:hypothetical protein